MRRRIGAARLHPGLNGKRKVDVPGVTALSAVGLFRHRRLSCDCYASAPEPRSIQSSPLPLPSDEENARSPVSDVQTLIERAAALWAHTRDATSSEGRIEFGRLALLYERMAVRVARRDLHRSTLGDLLYGDRIKDRTSEAEWVALVRGIAKLDQGAFQTLYLWTHRLVITLIMGITKDWFAAEELAINVFDDVWQGARKFDSFGDTVIGWVMNKARSRALESLRAAYPVKPGVPAATQGFEVLIDRSTDALPLSASLWGRIIERITRDSDDALSVKATAFEHEDEWEQPAPGIYCRILATETPRGRVSMLVRLGPGIEYPPHMHADVEEVHLLQGELWIDDRKLSAGDYNRAEPGTADKRTWSETGCTCVLITSSWDIIG